MIDNKEDNFDSKNRFKSKYHQTGFFGKTSDNYIADLDERVTDIEFRLNPTAKKILSTRSQQMLLLHHLGVLDLLNEYNISNIKKAKFLSVLLNASPDNIEKDLSGIFKPKSKIKTANNYKFITSVFEEAGIKKLFKETDIILDILESEEK